MATKEQLLLRIAELEKEVNENGEQQSRIKKTYQNKLNELQASKAKKEAEKTEAAQNKPLFGFTRAGKEYSARIAQIDAEIKDIQHQIDTLYDSDEEFSKLRARFSAIFPEYTSLKEQLKEFTFIEKLGTNCVYIYATGFLDNDSIRVFIDGNDMGLLPSPVGIYSLSDGAHSLYVTRNHDITEAVQFRLNRSNKFIYYKFEYYGRGYNKNSSNTFDEFVKDNGLYNCTVGIIKDHILNF